MQNDGKEIWKQKSGEMKEKGRVSVSLQSTAPWIMEERKAMWINFKTRWKERKEISE